MEILPLAVITDFKTHDDFRSYMKKRRIQITNYEWRLKNTIPKKPPKIYSPKKLKKPKLPPKPYITKINHIIEPKIYNESYFTINWN
jgi:hypothetical protein